MLTAVDDAVGNHGLFPVFCPIEVFNSSNVLSLSVVREAFIEAERGFVQLISQEPFPWKLPLTKELFKIIE